MRYKNWITILTMFISFLLFILLCSVLVFKLHLYHLDSIGMQPDLKEGSLLLCKQESFDKVNEGEVITFEIEDAYITSRVIKKSGNKEIYVKMDTHDEMNIIDYKQYKGTLLFSIPYLGTILYFFKGSMGRLICFVVLFLILIKVGLIILDSKKKRMSV